MKIKKQTKITKIFRRAIRAPPAEDSAEEDEEIKQLEQTLSDRRNELFQLQRNSYRHKPSALTKKPEPFIRPETIVLTSSLETSKKKLELMSMLTGIEIQSYVDGEHCTVVYHMQHDSPHQVKHGLMIDMKNGANDVSKTSLPLGFNLSEVLDGFRNVMLPDCLISIRRALVAYYDRLEQYDNLKTMINMEVELFKLLDGSHIEMTFTVRSEHDPEQDQFEVKLVLDYRVYDIRPKQYWFGESDMPEAAVDALKGQCSVFRTKPLHKAFKEAFIDGNGAYVMVLQLGTEREEQQTRQKPKRFRQANAYNDETFHPEDCSQSEDDN